MGQSYRDLIAWQKAIDFVMDVYHATRSFPRDEIYGLAAQLRRTAVLVPGNIAEGQARYSPAEFHHYLGRARGSLVEVETQVVIAEKLGYLSPDESQQLLQKAAELGRVMNGLASAIRPAA